MTEFTSFSAHLMYFEPHYARLVHRPAFDEFVQPTEFLLELKEFIFQPRKWMGLTPVLVALVVLSSVLTGCTDGHKGAMGSPSETEASRGLAPIQRKSP